MARILNTAASNSQLELAASILCAIHHSDCSNYIIQILMLIILVLSTLTWYIDFND